MSDGQMSYSFRHKSNMHQAPSSNGSPDWSHLKDEWLSQPSTLRDSDWRHGVQQIQDTATLRWFSATWGKERDRHQLMATPELPPPLADSPALRNLRTISSPPFLDPPIEDILVFADYDDLWRDTNLWLEERQMRFVPSNQPDGEVAPILDRSPPFEKEAEYIPHFTVRKAILCLGSAGIGKSMSLRYILIRRTFQSLPTIFCGSAGSWYICSDGVFKLPETLEYWDTPFYCDDGRRVVLADCNSQNPKPPTCWAVGPIPIIQASRPAPEHVHWITQLDSGFAAEWWFRPPCVWHAMAAVSLKYKANPAYQTDDFFDRLHVLYSTWGPSITELASTVYPASVKQDHMRRRRAIEFGAQAENPDVLPQLTWLFTHGPSIDDWILGRDVVNTAVLLTCGNTRAKPIAATMSVTVRQILVKHFGQSALEWRSCLGDRDNAVLSEEEDSNIILSPLSEPRSLSS